MPASGPVICLPSRSHPSADETKSLIRKGPCRYLTKHCDVGLLLKTPGARADNDSVEALFVRGFGRVHHRQKDGNSLAAAMFNDFATQFDRSVADTFWSYFVNLRIHVDIIRDLSQLFHRDEIRAEVRKVRKAHNAVFPADYFQNVLALPRGVYIAFLCGPPDHAVAAQ